jgi:hypothetical protein
MVPIHARSSIPVFLDIRCSLACGNLFLVRHHLKRIMGTRLPLEPQTNQDLSERNLANIDKAA